MWQTERFAELAKLLAGKLGAEVILTQGPKDAGVVEEVAIKAGGTVKVLGVLPVRQLAAILSHCSVYVANDSGPMHIAVAVNIPTIGIFGPGEENVWFPYNPPFYENSAGHVALRKDVFCHPCHLNVCNRKGDGFMECMKLLPAAEVFEEVKKRLDMKPKIVSK